MEYTCITLLKMFIKIIDLAKIYMLIYCENTILILHFIGQKNTTASNISLSCYSKDSASTSQTNLTLCWTKKYNKFLE